MADGLVQLLGEALVHKDGSCLKTSEVMAGKSSCLMYFSAAWCGPCRQFTPDFAAAYKEFKDAGGTDAEVVFVSWDKSDDKFKEYFGQMPWLAIPFEGTDDIRKPLGDKFKVRGIPTIVAVGPDGEPLHKDGDVDLRALVSQFKGKAFPMTPARVEELNREKDETRKSLLKEMSTSFPLLCAPGAEVAETSLADLFDKFEYVAMLLSDGDVTDGTYKAVSKIQAEVNSSNNYPDRLGIVYLGFCLYNAQCDHKPLAKDHYALLNLDDQLKEQLGQLPKKLGPPHVLVFKKADADSIEVVSDMPGCQAMQQYGASGFPWNEARISELKAEEKAKVDALKEKQTNLQFLKSETGDILVKSDGSEVKVDSLQDLGPDAVVGLYFSASWCGPCRHFTPVMAKHYEALKLDGKKFEVVFVSSDRDEDSFKQYFSDMPWLALPFPQRDVKKALSDIFEVRGIPSLVLLKPDGTVVTREGREALDLGPECFPWGEEDIRRGQAAAAKKQEEEMAAAREQEKADEAQQKADGDPIVKRLRGELMALQHASKDRIVEFKGFSTFGAPEMITKSGVLYYEVEILGSQGIPQFGFATAEFGTGDSDEYEGEGVGDDEESWGLDGTRKVLWPDGETAWNCQWSVGDVIGFAANMDTGNIAVAKSGDWSTAPQGVVFSNEKIKSGVYPCLTAGGYKVRYNFNGTTHGAHRFGPPPSSIWDSKAEPEEKAKFDPAPR